MEKILEHPKLSGFKVVVGKKNHQGNFFCDIQSVEPVKIEGLGFTFPRVEITLSNKLEAEESEIESIASILQFNESEKIELENDLYKAYTSELYPLYEDQYLNDWEFSRQEVDEMLPKIEHPSQVWKLIRDPMHITLWPLKSIYPYMCFSCVFDEEHDLHISFDRKKVKKVWTG